MTFDRKTYAREYARRARGKAWLQKAESATKCPRSLANGRRCKWPLENRMVNGVTEPFCAQCDRKARGICIDCKSAPVYGQIRKALRCQTCAKLERAAAEDRWKKRHPGTVRRQWHKRKKRLLANPDLRARELERKRAWRLAMPTKKAKYNRQWAQTERARAYQKEYRARYRALRADVERERQRRLRRGEIVTHACLGCRTPIRGRPKMCPTCKQKQMKEARALLMGAA